MMFSSHIKAIVAAIACVTMVGTGLSLTIPLLSLEMERMGLSGGWIGLNTSIAGLAGLVTLPFVPFFAARYGVVRLLIGASLACIVTLMLFKMTSNIYLWFPIRFVFSTALGVLFVLSEYWINQAAPESRRGLVMGIYATSLALGFAIGPAILKLSGTTGWMPYLSGAVLFAVAILPVLAARTVSPKTGEPSQHSVFFFMRAAPIATWAAFCFGAMETGGFSILPVYGLRLGFDESEAATLVSLMALGGILFQVPIGMMSDRYDRRYILLVLALLGIAGACSFSTLALISPLLFKAVLCVWGGLTASVYTVGLAHLGSRFSGQDLAGANAAYIMLYNVGLMIGPPVVGAGLDLWKPYGFDVSIAGFLVLYLVIIVVRLTGEERRNSL